MDADNLIRMANRIGDFFEAYPDRQEALESIALHLRRFWEPRMRGAFLQAVEGDAPGLTPIVQEAVQLHRSLIV